MRSFYLLSTLLVIGLSLSACKPAATDDKSTAPGTTTTASEKAQPATKKTDGVFGGLFSSTPEPVKSDLGEFKILEVNLGTSLDADNAVSKPRRVFGVKDKIYASVISNGQHPGLTIKARWTAPDGAKIAEVEQALAPKSAAVTTFSISNKQAWPTGKYVVTIFVNGSEEQAQPFDVN